MQHLADKLSEALDIVKDAIKKFTDKIGQVDILCQKAPHHIEHLFWLSQNVEDETIFQSTIESLSEYDKIQQFNKFEETLETEDLHVECGLR